jgi:Neprosin
MGRGFKLRMTVTAIGSVIAALGVPGISFAASGPVCGNAADTAPHCLVEAQQPSSNGQSIITSMAGLFTVPKRLNVRSPAYSIGQMALWGGSSGSNDIELGWIVDPTIYHGSKVPHLFVFFRRSLYGFGEKPACEEGLKGTKKVPVCPLSDYIELTTKYFAGMALGGGPSSQFFYVGYDSTDNYWYIQYQDKYIAKMSEDWWTNCGSSALCGSFKAGDNALWYGEVYTPNQKYSCTPMGNGKYGSGSGSATVSDMEYGTGGPTLVTASPLMLPPKYPKYWNTNRASDQDFSSSFRFGGPGDC